MGAISGDPLDKNQPRALEVWPPMADEITVDQALEKRPQGDRVSDHKELEMPITPSRVETGG